MSEEQDISSLSFSCNSYCSIYLTKMNHLRSIGLTFCSLSRRLSLEDSRRWNFELYDFNENDRFTHLDSFLNSLGTCQILVSDDLFEQNGTGNGTGGGGGGGGGGDGKKLLTLFQEYSLSITYVKKSQWKKNGADELIDKLLLTKNFASNSVEVFV
jgi:hypothetical protein